MAVARRTKSNAAVAQRTSLAMVVPAACVAGDILFAWVEQDNGSAITGPASGWTRIGSVVASATMELWWHRVVAGEPGVTSFTWTYANSWSQGGYVAYSGAPASGDPQDVAASLGSGITGTTVSHPTITTTTANAMVFAVALNIDVTCTHTNPFGTEYEEAASCATYDAIQAAAGATGAKTTTFSAAPLGQAGFLVAIRDAAAGGAAASLVPRSRLRGFEHMIIR